MKSRLLAIGAAALALTLGSVAPSFATTASGPNASIQGTISNTCTVNSTTSPGSQALTAGSAPAQTSGSISVTCTSGAPYNVQMGIGSGTGATDGATPTRFLMNGANTLSYQIYRDAAKTQVFGDTSGTNTVAVTGNGSAQSTTFYVNIATPTLSNPAGTYSDTVAVTVAY